VAPDQLLLATTLSGVDDLFDHVLNGRRASTAIASNGLSRATAQSPASVDERIPHFSNSGADSSSNLGANRWLSANATR
jgi:hypothetical protein